MRPPHDFAQYAEKVEKSHKKHGVKPQKYAVSFGNQSRCHAARAAGYVNAA